MTTFFHRMFRPPGNRKSVHQQPHADIQPRTTAEDSPPSGWRVGRVFGVPLYAQPSGLAFFALLALLYTPVVSARFPGIGALGFVVALTVPALIGVSVLGHELGHLLAGRLTGIPATRITMDLLGGETQFDRDAPTAGREAAIAASGPAASVLMAAIGYAVLTWSAPVGFTGLLVAQFTLVNLLLAAFNLLPGLPLDGGWILRAGLWKATGRPTLSVRAAAWIGRLLAAALAADLAVRIGTGSPVGVLTLAVTGMVAFQIWSGASAVLRETPRARRASRASGLGGAGSMMGGVPGTDPTTAAAGTPEMRSTAVESGHEGHHGHQ